MAVQTSVKSGTASQSQDEGRKTNKQRKRNNKKSDGGPTLINASGKPSAEVEKPSSASSQLIQSGNGDEENDDRSICWICAEPVKFYALSECNHRTCHVCAVRLRALYKKLECTFCKHSQDVILFTSSPDAPFNSYDVETIQFKDNKLAIVFETQEMMDETLILLRFNCSDSECTYVASSWNDLKLHVRATHGKVMCDLCIRFKKVFAHEHALYPPGQLYQHLPSLNYRPHKDVPKDKVDGGVHPLCEFCHECFFGDDELFSHMRERHEECFVCKRNGVRDKYFMDYARLEKHFNYDHHPCKQPPCLAQKFVVFGSALDLQAHMVEEHGELMSARDKKDARRITAEFRFEEGGSSSHEGRRRREGGSSQPSAASQPNSRNKRREGFGATLTAPERPATESITPPPESRAASRPQSPPATVESDPVTIERHAAFLSRVAALTSNSSSAISAIKSSIVSFRASESTARDLISTFYNVFERDLDATASLIVTLVDLLDNDEKRTDLLQSWNGFKIEQRREFPDLTPGAIGTGYAGVASGKVLNAKHSTGSRSSLQSTRQVWDRVARAAASTAGPSSFQSTMRPSGGLPPRKPTPVSQPANSFRQPEHKTAWVSSAQASSTVEGPRTQNNGRNTLSTPPPLSNTAFPTLPSSSGTRQKPLVSGNRSLQNILGNSVAPPTAWKAGEKTPSGAPSDADTPLPIAEESDARRGKKKKGKEKQTLFTLGSFPT